MKRVILRADGDFDKIWEGVNVRKGSFSIHTGSPGGPLLVAPGKSYKSYNYNTAYDVVQNAKKLFPDLKIYLQDINVGRR